MKHTDTKTYVDLVTRLAQLEAARAGLAGTRLGAHWMKFHAAVFDRSVSDLKRLLDRVTRLESTFNDEPLAMETMFMLLVEALNTAWTDHQRRLNELPRLAFEGAWEKGIRAGLGLPLDPTQGDCDLPDGSEIKCLSSWQFRTNKSGVRSYIDAVNACRSRGFDVSSFEHGELPEGRLSTLPQEVRSTLQKHLAPSVVLGRHPTLYLCTDDGYLAVPCVDLDVALSLQRVSQGKPRYRLRPEYLAARLRALT